MNSSLAPFPTSRPDALACADVLRTRGFLLRLAHLEDMPFLRGLYGILRADEISQIAWPDNAKQAFLDSQFQLQHHHFVTHYALSDFFIVEHAGADIGRFYLLRQQPYFLVVDIALLPAWRGQGLGTALLKGAGNLASASGAAGIDLHVDERNSAARQLYTRLGFKETKQEGPYIRMRWTCLSVTQLNTA